MNKDNIKSEIIVKYQNIRVLRIENKEFISLIDLARYANPEIADKGNIRNYTDLLHLVILNNLENINAELIEMKISQNERLVRLNNIARKQMELLKDNKSFNNLEYIEIENKNKVNNKQKLPM